jgi:uncharacterized protein YbjT (DUF2867 family)
VILVIGATGKVGRAVVDELVASGARVRALVRDAAAELPDAAQVATGDLLDATSLRAALRGVAATFLIWPLGDAAAAGDVVPMICRHSPRVVYLSTAAIQDGLEHQAHPLSAMHATVEHEIARSDTRWTVLRATKFATNTLAWANAIRAGDAVEGAYGDQRRAPIHQRDIAAVAARMLLGDDHSARRYVLSGPESLTERDQVQILAEVLGRTVAWRELSPETARERLLAGGASPELADAALAYWARLVSEPEPVTDVVARLTGSPARSFRQWAQENANSFR